MSAACRRRALPPLAVLPLLAALALALPPPAAAARRLDQDFEFDDAPAPSAPHAHRLVYDPDNPLCRALRCPRREQCVLRDGLSAQCAARRDADGRAGCVGCAGGRAARGAFLCGSDNRTYSSLCRLDLHNCVRRAEPPVRLACRGFCPCGPRDQERRRRRPRPAGERRAPAGPAGCAADSMADRLLDWFGVLLEEARGAPPPPRAGFPRGCQPEVRWMFAHLDAAGDGLLSPEDLYALRHDDRERCLRPFLASCGAGGEQGERGERGLSRAAWCSCLRRAARPCAALARAHPAPPPGAYVPACDARGWYRPRQCHLALGVCWCVDAHGVERPGSRTRGAAPCPGDHAAEAQSGPDDDEDAGGSGDDNELRF